MAKMTREQYDYLRPVLDGMYQNIIVLGHRIKDRNIRDWNHSEFMIVCATAEEIAKSARFAHTALSVIADVERGELEK